jgi:hypothetical protein
MNICVDNKHIASNFEKLFYMTAISDSGYLVGERPQ